MADTQGLEMPSPDARAHAAVRGDACSATMGDTTFPKLLAVHVAARPDAPAIREKALGIWQTWTWDELDAEVSAIAGALGSESFARGDTLALIGENRPRLYAEMLAAQSLGGVPVPISAPRAWQEARPTTTRRCSDLRRCRGCGAGALKIIAAILQRAAIGKILIQLGLDRQLPPWGRASEAGHAGHAFAASRVRPKGRLRVVQPPAHGACCRCRAV
jgi:hypothetical protein